MTARIASLDAARGLAIVAMIVFHLIWDLGNFGYIDASIPFSAGVKLFGHAIGIVFLLIVGVSLVLAHPRGARAFWRRFALIAGSAALVSLGTYLIFPQTFVFFGILHCIALASLLAAPLVIRPWPTALAIGLIAILAPLFLSSPVFDTPLLSWIGLSTITPATNDYRPVLPWTGYVFLGVAAANFWRARGLTPIGANWRIGPLERVPIAWNHAIEKDSLKTKELEHVLIGKPLRTFPGHALGFLGRHSLGIYLLHQPVLFALFYGLSLAGMAPSAPAADEFITACELRCVEADVELDKCRNLCACTAKRAASMTSAELADPEKRAARLEEIAEGCFGEKR